MTTTTASPINPFYRARTRHVAPQKPEQRHVVYVKLPAASINGRIRPHPATASAVFRMTIARSAVPC